MMREPFWSFLLKVPLAKGIRYFVLTAVTHWVGHDDGLYNSACLAQGSALTIRAKSPALGWASVRTFLFTFVEASYAIHLGIPCTKHRVRRT